MSFKGLFLNLGHGGIGLLYALLLTFMNRQVSVQYPEIVEESLKNQVFTASLPWFVGDFTCLFLIWIST